MLLGYNTNGFAHHLPHEAIEVLAAIGYRAVALTIDHGLLSPRDLHWQDQAKQLREQTEELGMQVVIETGARFLLDPWEKHKPTLVSHLPKDRSVRIEFLLHSIQAAKLVGANAVSLWAGISTDGEAFEALVDRLALELIPLLAYATEEGIDLAFEPEPGMAIETLAQFSLLKHRIAELGGQVGAFRLTADIGHLHCLGEIPLDEHLKKHSQDLVNLHIEDMKHGVHEHLEFGEGEIDFAPVIGALAEVGYAGPLCVELSRHSHAAPQAAQRAYDFLMPLVESAEN